MRGEYAAFAAIFENLDGGSLFGAFGVKKAAGLIDPLIGRMSACATTLTRHPAVFSRERTAIATSMERVRKDTTSSEKQKGQTIGTLRQRWQTMLTAEDQITKDTVSQCLTAAKVGRKLKSLLNDYDKL